LRFHLQLLHVAR